MNRIFFPILFFALFLFSCGRDKEKQPENLRFEKEYITKMEGENCDTLAYECSVISMVYFRARGPEKVASRINQELTDHVITLVASPEEAMIRDRQGLVDYFINSYRKAADLFSEEPPWEVYIEEKIYLNKKEIISVGISAEIFTGGAHGYKSLSFLNFDPATGNRLTPEDLFTRSFLDLAEMRFREIMNIPEEENINSSGFWFEGDQFRLPRNLGFTSEEVILVYNAYEIAPYAAGEILLKIPLKEAEPHLKFKM